jgi:IS5 family transposase
VKIDMLAFLQVSLSVLVTRSRVEHSFHILKNHFKHRMVRYRGLADNHHQMQVIFEMVDLVLSQRLPA